MTRPKALLAIQRAGRGGGGAASCAASPTKKADAAAAYTKKSGLAPNRVRVVRPGL